MNTVASSLDRSIVTRKEQKWKIKRVLEKIYVSHMNAQGGVT